MQEARPERRTFAGLKELLGEEDFERLYAPKIQMAVALGKVKQESQVYAGTVPAAVVAKRRKQNRVARQSRRVNRGRR